MLMIADNMLATAVEIRILVAIMTRMTAQALEQRLEGQYGGLSHLQVGIMQMLVHEKQTISELSQKFRLAPSTLVPAIDALERKGLVSRLKDPDDRRRVPIDLTEAGRNMITHLPIVDRDDPLVQGLEAMGAEHSEQLLELLREVIRHMPEGDEIIEQVHSRLHVHIKSQAAESCPQHLDSGED